MTVHHIIPPYLLEHLERTAPDPTLRARYRQSLQRDAVFRTRPGIGASAATPESGGLRREVHDAQHETTLPGTLVRAEGADAVQDAAVNQAYDGTGATWTMYKECFDWDSIDGAGLPLISTVHYDRDYANAFWDGSQMVFGDGDGEIFGDFTGSVDVTGHELTHGVTQYTANLTYDGQPGALNESISDVFGSLAKQHNLGQTAADADWLIGAGIFRPGVQGVALRSMAAPGTAYDDPRLGKDPQPAHMSGYVETTEDSGGVHINSGIPNRAFYLVATALGGNSWSEAGRIWYATLTSGTLPATADFATFAAATQSAATALFGPTSPQLTAVTTAWQQVGVLTDSTPSNQPTSPSDTPPPSDQPDSSPSDQPESAPDQPETPPADPPESQPADPSASPASDQSDSAPPSDQSDSAHADQPDSARSDQSGPPPADQPVSAPSDQSDSPPAVQSDEARAAESAELMRAANATLAPNTPPAQPEPSAEPRPAEPRPAEPRPANRPSAEHRPADSRSTDQPSANSADGD